MSVLDTLHTFNPLDSDDFHNEDLWIDFQSELIGGGEAYWVNCNSPATVELADFFGSLSKDDFNNGFPFSTDELNTTYWNHFKTDIKSFIHGFSHVTDVRNPKNAANFACWRAMTDDDRALLTSLHHQAIDFYMNIKDVDDCAEHENTGITILKQAIDICNKYHNIATSD